MILKTCLHYQKQVIRYGEIEPVYQDIVENDAGDERGGDRENENELRLNFFQPFELQKDEQERQTSQQHNNR